MRVAPTNESEYYNGSEIGRYGIDKDTKSLVFTWYHDGLQNSRVWAMDTHVARKIKNEVQTIIIADEDAQKAFAVDRTQLRMNTKFIDGRQQHVISEDEAIDLGQPKKILAGSLWITSDRKNTGYHKKKNEA